MKINNRYEERPVGSRLRNLAASSLMLLAMFLLAACGGGSDGGGNGGGGNGGGGNGGGGNGGGGNGGGGGDKSGEKAGAGGGGGTMQGGGEGGKGAVITDLRVVFATMNPKDLNGERARLKGVEVRELVSDRAFFVGESDAERLFVVNVGEDQAGVSEGQSVVVAGALNTPRPELEEKLALTADEAAVVNEQKIFLRAARVEPQEQE